MNPVREYTFGRTESSVLTTNKVLRNTYALLAMTLLFSAFTAGISMFLGLPHPGLILTLVGFYGLTYATTRLQNSVWGLAAVFALTGFMGLTLGPIISHYIHFFRNGSELVMLAMGGTGAIFLGLSAYAVTTKKDFSFMAGFLMAGILAAFVLSLVAILFHIPALALATSALFMLLMSGSILYQTSEIIHGGETNYISATVSLYVSIYNMFISLLQMLGIFGGDSD
jgi:modulator of FtsH protease